ncbi:alpha/beta hydrolase [Diaminobutyricibacter tongyongensis]|uniref:Alpha/beta hydrolase n=1 Tax=Leifsonia tongyongensis TaxID=1268043 RepID=A0A6L9XU84_9MICO|nr:alpha/beta hydrolase [Diaminobutyricibacter tongyongensis]NEN04952.1 alpha/beta hydrolase [Diaminobutyricibacter tongyongensis]
MPPFIPPEFDRELHAALDSSHIAPTITAEMIPALRLESAGGQSTDEFLAETGLTRHDVVIDGHQGDQIVVSVIKAKAHTGFGPGILNIHGGGMITGTRFDGLEQVAPWIVTYGAVVVTVEYRLAPEFPDPYPVEDCYAALHWTADNAANLGIDSKRLLIMGGSAGGGLAAGTTLLARDRRGPVLTGQVLLCPMIDDRDLTISAHQIDGIGVWDRGSNRVGWDALLGSRCGSDDVSIYAAPARASDLSGLPPTYIDVGSAEVFRDEVISYASRIWEAGGSAELHVWSGGFHGFEVIAPQAAVTRASVAARNSWVDRLLRGNVAESAG